MTIFRDYVCVLVLSPDHFLQKRAEAPRVFTAIPPDGAQVSMTENVLESHLKSRFDWFNMPDFMALCRSVFIASDDP